MPVEFLSQERRERLGRFSDDPTAEQLARYFHLDDADRAVIDRRWRERARLGFALQLGTVRFLGTFLADPSDVPRVVVDYVARQLRIADLSVLEGYGDSETRWDHAAEIRRAYGYRDFGDEAVHGRLRGWLEARAWTMGERRGCAVRPGRRLAARAQGPPPGPSVLERLVASVHDQANARLWSILASAPSPSTRRALEELLAVPPGGRRSGFERLRHGPRAPSAAGITAALHRLEEVRALGVGGLDLAGIPQGRVEALARFTAKARAQAPREPG